MTGFATYSYDEQTRFVITDYNRARPFSSFLPGLAGVDGKPIWAFYVNRGQGIASFGVRDKDGAIMEFQPAFKSYQTVPLQGFRTFLRFADGGWVEPFAGTGLAGSSGSEETMKISPNELELRSRGLTLHDSGQPHAARGLEVTVNYFTMPGESFAALVRQVTIRNIGEEACAFDVLDGMPAVLPYGLSNGGYKELGHTLRAWMDVFNLDCQIPYYKLRAGTADSAEVSGVDAGHFYLSFSFDGEQEKLLQPIVDAELVFGGNTSLVVPDTFLQVGWSGMEGARQVTTNKVPCGFSGANVSLEPGGVYEFHTIIGHTARIESINGRIGELANRSYIQRKRQEAQQLVEEMTKPVRTRSMNRLFDAYCEQSYLDNLLRGGKPVLLQAGGRSFVYHLYSRKHGDLERDYNFFSLDPSYYSQGNGNFRDTNQNRRNDIYFQPEIGDFNIVQFMSLIQADGYNPLVVKGSAFYIDDPAPLLPLVGEAHRDRVVSFLAKPFNPGKLLALLEDEEVELTVPRDEFLARVLLISSQEAEADFGEGYWIDHWTYNMDLIESYLAVYPDRLEELLFGEKKYRYYDSPAVVLPRCHKYVLAGERVRQYGAVEENEEKIALLARRSGMRHWVRFGGEEGEVYRTYLYEKLVHLALMKFATLDVDGIGVEMEAGKPGWNDSLNGLPGLLASGFSELCELARLLRFIEGTSGTGPNRIELPAEIAELLGRVDRLLIDYENTGKTPQDDFLYWDNVSEAREQYRGKVKFGFSGSLRQLSRAEVESAIGRFIGKVQAGIAKAERIGDGVYPTYFYYEAVEYEPLLEGDGTPRLDSGGRPLVRVKAFRRKQLPYFLEGPARAMKILPDESARRNLYELVRKTELYDRKLGMYKVNAPLDGESHEIGRSRAFTPGWLENESVFLHMAYKYLLELLKGGLYEEFFEEMRRALVPFMDPNIYGRSTLEISSFIASSANPDESLHGAGFVARLSGSTAEFLSMWNAMLWGKRPFVVEDGVLHLRLAPTLPDWLFDKDGTITATFLGYCEVVYRNPARKNTYGADRVSIGEMALTMEDGRTERVQGGSIGGQLALAVREKRVIRMEVKLV